MPTKYRIENDSMGEVKVPTDAYWGAQTQRSLSNFRAGSTLPLSFIYALAIAKRASAKANAKLGVLGARKASLIVKVCDEIIESRYDDQFPLKIFQTGSGTQTNMNLNEVIANRAHVIGGGKLTDKSKILHPNDDVNKSQSSNDIVPVAMHIAAHQAIAQEVLPTLASLIKALKTKQKEFARIVKVGRTHMMDAVPLTVGQEISGWIAQLEHAKVTLQESLPYLLELPIGGTAIGTGLNTPRGFDKAAVKYIAQYTKSPFKVMPNKFHGIAAHGALVKASSALKITAVELTIVASNIRLLASGPRTGVSELILPAGEPGSSIMPGKVNPTQAEALIQACHLVIGNDMSVTLGATESYFQLNTAKPLIIASLLESADILAATVSSFTKNCVVGMKPNREVIKRNLDNTLMLVTALSPHIGYDKAAEISHKAHKENITLKEAALALGIKDTDFDRWVDPLKMI